MPAQQQSRKDILQAYRLMTDRIALAFIAGEPDSPNQPLRRRSTATISGILVGVIAVALAAVWGVVSPGGSVKGLTAANTLTIDKDTGTAYVPCKIAGQEELCPALNFASARLALDNANPNTQSVSQAALAGYTIGPTVGIQGLPQDLPTGKNLITGPWSVCSQNGKSTLVGGQSVGKTALSSSQAILAQASIAGQDTYWIIANGIRMQIFLVVRDRLFSQFTPVPVSAAWLNAIPQGPDFVAPSIPGAGDALHAGIPVAQGPDGEPAVVGQAYQAQENQFFALLQGGKLAPITELQAQLLNTAKGTRQSPTGGIAPLINAAQIQNLSGSLKSTQLPATLPKPASVPAAAAVCVTYGTDLSRQFSFGGNVPAGEPTTGGTGLVDQVSVPSGHGALIGVTTDTITPRASSQILSRFLLVGATRYGMSSPAVPGVLGYSDTSQVVLPASVVGLVPQGGALDPSKANQHVSG